MLVCPHMITHWLVYISYAMGTRDLPDIYTLSPRVYISGKPLVAIIIIAPYKIICIHIAQKVNGQV